jgi:hypothetical protein
MRGRLLGQWAAVEVVGEICLYNYRGHRGAHGERVHRHRETVLEIRGSTESTASREIVRETAVTSELALYAHAPREKEGIGGLQGVRSGNKPMWSASPDSHAPRPKTVEWSFGHLCYVIESNRTACSHVT